MFRFYFVIVFPACIIFTIYGVIYRIVLQKVRLKFTVLSASLMIILNVSVEARNHVKKVVMLLSTGKCS